MAGTFSRDGRDYYKTPDGQLVSVEAGFDAATAYQGLAPATAEDVQARDYEKATAHLQQDERFDRDAQGYVDPNAAFGDVAPLTPEAVAEFQTAPPEAPPEPKAVEPAQAFSKGGRDYYLDQRGKLVSVDAGFDPSTDYPWLKPATEEQWRKHDLQKRRGSLVDQVETFGHTAAATVAEAAAQAYNYTAGIALSPSRTYTGKDIALGLFGTQETEQREANPVSAVLGAAVPDLIAARYIPGGAAAKTEGTVIRGVKVLDAETTAARTLASAWITEAGNAVIEPEEFDADRVFSVWAPTQVIFEGALNVGGRVVGKAFGHTRNALSNLAERSRTSAAEAALRETDPKKAAELLRKNADAIYERAQTQLDESLDAIDQRLTESPDRLFTPGALKKTVSANINAQADAFGAIRRRVAQAAEVTDAPALKEAAKALETATRWGGPAMFRAAREAWRALDEAALDSPLAREALDALETTLGDEKTWGKAARYHRNAIDEARRTIGPVERRSVKDLTARERIEQRLEQARAMAKLTKDDKLAADVEKAARALGDADKATGARVMATDATNEEIAAMRKTLDGFPDRAPKIGEQAVEALDALEELAPEAFEETWTVERLERHIAERVAGSKVARKQLDDTIERATKWLEDAKRGGSVKPNDIAKATRQIEAVRALLDEVDEVAKARKIVRDYDAAVPRGRAEKLIDKVTGTVASKIVSKIGTTAAGAATGYAGGGPVGAAIGGLAAQAVEGAVENVVRERASKFGQWLKESLRKHKGTAAGVAALYGANRLAHDESDPSPNAAAAAATAGLSFLLTGKLKLRDGDMPGAARSLLEVNASSLEHRITPGMNAEAVARHVDQLLDGWTAGFTRNTGRAPNTREIANARDVLARRAVDLVEPRAVKPPTIDEANDDMLRGEIDLAVQEMAKDGRPITAESLQHYVRHYVRPSDHTAGELARLEQIIGDNLDGLQAAGERLQERARAAVDANAPMHATDAHVTAATTRMQAATRSMQADDEVANDALTRAQNYLKDYMTAGTTGRRYQELIRQARSDYRTEFENAFGRSPNERELEWAEAMLDLTGQSQSREFYRARDEAKRLAAEENAASANAHERPFRQRQQQVLARTAEDLGLTPEEGEAALARLSADDRAWLARAIEETAPDDALRRFLDDGLNLLGHRIDDPGRVLADQMGQLRVNRGAYVANARGVRRPLPGSREWREFGELHDDLSSAALYELERINRDAATNATPPRPPITREQLRQQRYDRGREMMHGPSEDRQHELGQLFSNDELGPNPTAKAVDAVVDRIRKDQRLTVTEEVWLRDQLNQASPAWDGQMLDAIEEAAGRYSGHIDDIPTIGADDVLEWLEKADYDITSWDEFAIRHEMLRNGRGYSERYRDLAERAAEKAASAAAERAAAREAGDDERYYDDADEELRGAAYRGDRYNPAGGANGLPKRDVLEGLGIEDISVYDPDGVINVFGQGLREEDMRQLFALDQLRDYAKKTRQRIDTSLSIESGRVHFRGEVGEMHVERKYTARRDGRGFDIYNAYFILPTELQDEGLGKVILRGMADAQERLGGKEMSLSAAWVGRYIWPKLGFRPSPSDEQACIAYFQEKLARWMQTTTDNDLVAARMLGIENIRDVADARIPLERIPDNVLHSLESTWEALKGNDHRHWRDTSFAETFVKEGKDGKPDQFNAGKFFLMTSPGGWNGGLRIRIAPGTPWYDDYRARIMASAAFLGFGMSELLDAMNQSRMTTWTGESPWEEDANKAQQILDQARDEAAARDEEREQELDETRDKLGFLSHQGRTLMTATARQLASPSREARVVERVPGVTASAGVARFLGSHSTVTEAYQEKRELLQRLQRDPMALVEDLSENLSELQQRAPALHAQTVAQTYKVAQFLQSKLPGTVGADLTRPDGAPPNPLAIRQFALYYSAATDPASVLTDLANNRARREQIETLREVWPSTYDQLKVAVVEHISRARPSVTQRALLDLRFDFGPGTIDRAFSPGLVAALDEYRAAKGPGSLEAGAPGKVPGRASQASVRGSSPLRSLAYGPASGPGTLA